MRIIAHRGNTNGAYPDKENTPEYLLDAVKRGFYVEVDVWKIGDKYFLGHDLPTHEVDKFFLFNNKFYVHCKNIQAFTTLSNYSQINCFYQTTEHVVLTSRGDIWFHSDIKSEKYGNMRSIYVRLESPLVDNNLGYIGNYYGLCTDYAEIYNNLLNVPKDFSTPFDMLVLDIDGVLTNGTKLYNLEGKTSYKAYCDKDFTAIKRFKACGIPVVFLSGDTVVNKQMAESRGIDFYHSRDSTGNIDKSRFINQFKEQYNVSRLAYVGDDYYDLTMLNSVELSLCPHDACEDVKSCVDVVLDTNGGEGVVAEIFEKYKHLLNEPFAYDSYAVNPK
jgi:3-deoxy-D-manno-octulosonate 8-phosphate phosphatase (KDO 8-P phosphatase)